LEVVAAGGLVRDVEGRDRVEPGRRGRGALLQRHQVPTAVDDARHPAPRLRVGRARGEAGAQIVLEQAVEALGVRQRGAVTAAEYGRLPGGPLVPHELEVREVAARLGRGDLERALDRGELVLPAAQE